MSTNTGHKGQKTWLDEIIQPFIDLYHAPRALWGINLAYVLEGMVYFGMLGYLAMHFADFIFQRVEHSDEWSHLMVMMLTGGITLAMALLGFIPDKRGVRFALITAFVFMLIGRGLWAGAPNLLGLEPARPGVFAGDKVSLHVTGIDTQDDVKTITAATVIANDEGASGVRVYLDLDLAEGEGMAPGAALESRLVSLSQATVLAGKEQTWKVEYGSKPVTAYLFANAAEQAGLCVGAVISVDRAYVSFREWKDKEDMQEWVIRTHWAEDFSQVDMSACTQEEKDKARKAMDSAENVESLLKSKDRWTVAAETDAVKEAEIVNIAGLRELDDGKVNVVLRDVLVSYVRNGGYLLQTEPDGPAIYAFVSPFWSPLHIVTLCGMMLVVIGYGMYQPAAYAGVRKFTTPKTAAMGFAMLYALMNLGGWLPSFAFLLRDDDWAGLGIPGMYWVYTGFTLIALITTFFILSRITVRKAIDTAKEETARIKAEEEAEKGASKPARDEQAQTVDEPVVVEADRERIKPHMWLFWLAGMAIFLFKGESPWYHTWEEALWRWIAAGIIFILPLMFALIPPAKRWLARYPLSNGKFAFFIFALIPVQTLFTYNWLVLPQYIKRAYEGWIGEYFEIAANSNPILIFIAVPIIVALSQKAKVYNMMIFGTFIMAAPAFLLVLGPHWWTLAAYILIMTIGEAMWQPRFLQYAAEIAPEGRTGEYMGVAQLPWFLTKVLVPLLYSGRLMDRFCPADGPKNTEVMWLIFACIAMSSTVMLILAKGWIGKDFKTKAD
ncbi:MAG: MFS transporter [Phycisphaerae bacterium]|nr:MFS transporter [Phycisphaerae bacterium]